VVAMLYEGTICFLGLGGGGVWLGWVYGVGGTVGLDAGWWHLVDAVSTM
jgi:hypothetical protein